MNDEYKKELRRVIAQGVFLGAVLSYVTYLVFAILINRNIDECMKQQDTPLKDLPAKCFIIFR